ncbi:MAG: hypothetical protein VYD19_01550 [Myxococcota bacterium]|nr:hypothetical protein [Myxococcota bacterium]
MSREIEKVASHSGGERAHRALRKGLGALRNWTIPVALIGFFLGCEEGFTPASEAPQIIPTPMADRALPREGGVEEVDLAIGDRAVDLGTALDAALDAANFAPIPFAVETRVGERNTPAGLENRITCQVLDQVGQPISTLSARPEIVPNRGFQFEDGVAIGERARSYEITCFAPTLGLIDPSPAQWTVLPAAPAQTLPILSTDRLRVGEFLEVECRAFDRFGNVTDAVMRPRFSPADGIEKIGGRWRLSAGGMISVRCDAPGVERQDEARVEAVPGLPDQIDLRFSPERASYRVGEVLRLQGSLFDENGSLIPGTAARFTFSVNPPLPSFGLGRLSLEAPGEYLVTARYEGETLSGDPLEVSVPLSVDFNSGGLRCTYPAQGDQLSGAEGGEVQLEGGARERAEGARLFVDGVEVPLSPEGEFRTPYRPTVGLNIVELELQRPEGTPISQFCAFYYSETRLEEGAALDDALSLHLGQATLDDGRPDQPIGSLTDLLRRVVNSPGLPAAVDQAARAQNPIVPNECRASVLGLCLFRFGATYEGFGISDNNELQLTLLDRGLRARVELKNIEVRARFQGTLGNRARISTSSAIVDIDFGVGVDREGRPSVQLRRLNEVSLGRLDADFSGWLTGAILELAFRAFEGLIRRTVTDALRDFLERELARTLSGLFSDVEIGSLGAGLTVPPLLSGGRPLPLRVEGALGALRFRPDGITLSLSTSVAAPARRGGETPGIPLSIQAAEEAQAAPVDVRIQLAILNQLFQALWRGGWFEAEGADLAPLLGEEEVSLEIELTAPPYIGSIQGEEVATLEVSLGPLIARVQLPGFFEEPVPISAAARLTVSLSIDEAQQVIVEGVEVARLVLAAGEGLPAAPRARVEALLERLLSEIIEVAVRDAFPELPIPTLAMPEGFEAFTLPPTLRLGLREAQLNSNTRSWRLSGEFGERP